MGRKRKHVEESKVNEPPQKKQQPTTDLPPGIYHYQTIDEVPGDIQKYEPPDVELATLISLSIDIGSRATRSSQNTTMAFG